MRVGFIGWRGMVGSVLMDRMRAEGDFEGLDAAFFSTSSPGQPGPDVGQGVAPLLDAHDVDLLSGFDVLLTCQGGDYTNRMFPALRSRGWTGVWIDAASALRSVFFCRTSVISAIDAEMTSAIFLLPSVLAAYIKVGEKWPL